MMSLGCHPCACATHSQDLSRVSMSLLSNKTLGLITTSLWVYRYRIFAPQRWSWSSDRALTTPCPDVVEETPLTPKLSARRDPQLVQPAHFAIRAISRARGARREPR